MKLTALCIAMAMICMTLEGCSRFAGDDETYGQKVERGLAGANQVLVPVGGKQAFDAGSRDDFVMSAVAALSDTGWIKTSERGQARGQGALPD